MSFHQQWLIWFPQATGADRIYPTASGLMRAVRKDRGRNDPRREWTYDPNYQPVYDGRMGWEYPSS